LSPSIPTAPAKAGNGAGAPRNLTTPPGVTD